ncbi:hypothetical protein A4X13_0g8809, partial [Tilletia indica]
MTASTSPATWLELDVVTLAKVTFLLGFAGVLLAPLARFFLQPYSKSLRNLPGPPIKHWFWGSWPKEAFGSGQFENHLNATIEEYGPVFGM